MFKYIAEAIARLLIRSKAVDVEERDIYEYGLEVLLLNSVNVLTAMIISLISGTMWHFACFMLIFAPLRIFSGGYHAKRSETCFVISTLIYITTVLIIKLNPLLYLNTGVSTTLLVLIFLLAMKLAPVVNKNNPLNEHEFKRNRLISIVLTAVDSVVFIVLKILDFYPASSVMIFLAVNSIMMLVGAVKENSNRQKRDDIL